MSLTTIKLTEFRVEKLRCMGGQRRSSPYRITLFEGGTLGKMGSVAALVAKEMATEIAGETASLKSANHDDFEPHGSRRFRRLLNLFGL